MPQAFKPKFLSVFSFEELVQELTASHDRLKARLTFLEAQNRALAARTHVSSVGEERERSSPIVDLDTGARIETAPDIKEGDPPTERPRRASLTVRISETMSAQDDEDLVHEIGIEGSTVAADLLLRHRAEEEAACPVALQVPWDPDVLVGPVPAAQSKPAFPSKDSDADEGRLSTSRDEESGRLSGSTEIQRHTKTPLVHTETMDSDVTVGSEVGADVENGVQSGWSWPFRRTQVIDTVPEDADLVKKTCGLRSVITGEATPTKSRWAKFVMTPDSAKRLMWDLLTVIIVSYDCVQFPFEFVFGRTDHTILSVVDFSTTVFWTIDVPVSFFTGYHSAGLVEVRLKEIARHYAKRWFVLDLTAVLLDWLFLLIEIRDALGVLQVARTAKVSRLTRVFRAMRMLRFVKFYRVLSEIFMQIKSEQLRAVCNILLMILGLVFANHYIACGWYFIGTQESQFDTVTWLTITNIRYRDVMFKYTTALHWSLTQFTPASMDVSATNVVERVYSICVLLFALVTFTSFVSSITTSMTHLRKMRSEPEKQEAILREYFFSNNLTAELGQRVWKYLWANHFSIKKRLHEQDVAILNLVPDFLRWKIREELHFPVITRLPFLAQYATVNLPGVQEICHHAMEERVLVASDELFVKDTIASKLFFVTGGFLHYKHHIKVQECDVGEKEWAVEPALWLKWCHVGTMIAKTTVEINSVDVAIFWKTMMRHSKGFDFLLSYKRNFNDYIVGRLRSDMISLPLGSVRSNRTRSFRNTVSSVATTSSQRSANFLFHAFREWT